MMGPTHRIWSATMWLGIAAVVDVTAARTGHGIPLPVVEIGIGLPLAMLTSGGTRFSPDRDLRWAPGFPRPGYHWKGHRGWTHRWWFAGVLVLLTAAGAVLSGHASFLPIWAPVFGWCTHLVGDMIFGRLRVLGKARGWGWDTGGFGEKPFTWLCVLGSLAATGGLLWFAGTG
jgi:membrane-bound metal-dependent hydrolase YbcI (DUF457 family)